MQNYVRRVTCLVIAGTAFAGLASSPALAQSNEVAIVSWGGSYQDAQKKAFFDPFTAATGITVIEGTGPQIERTRAEVETGRPSFDLVATNLAFNMIGVEQNLWEPIDYSVFDPAVLAAMPEEYRQEYGVGHIAYSEAIAYSTETYPEGAAHPSGYVDFWDVATFPGMRTIPWCDVATYPLPEAALIADGVAPADVYPIDVERALNKLKEIKPHVIWSQDINQAAQLIANGEVVVGMVPSGRTQILIDDGAPVKLDWKDARYTFDVWYVLKGAPNKDNAMKFIAYASTPEPQAEMARLSGYAPTNPDALPLLDEATSAKMPTFPANFAGQFKKDEGWWKDNRIAWVEACVAALR